jgi:hypothetical protein
MTLPKDYFINTEKDGRLGRTTEADLDRMFAILRERERVVIHVHGGLVTEERGFRTAESLHTSLHVTTRCIWETSTTTARSRSSTST